MGADDTYIRIHCTHNQFTNQCATQLFEEQVLGV